MGSSIRLALVSVLAAAAVGCGLGPVRCDDPDNACFLPPPQPSVTLGGLRNQPRGSYSPDAAVPLESVVITAYNDCVGCIGGHVGDTWVQATSPLSATNCPLLPNGTARACAMQIYEPAFSPIGYHPAVGDVVNLSGGTYSEFQCATCGHPPSPFVDPYFVPEINKPTISPAGVTPLPVPIPVSLADLQSNILLYMGVLVTVQDITAASGPDTHGSIPIMGSDPSNGLTIEEEQVLIPSVFTGTHWDSITGIATYFYNPELIPRSSSDLVNQH